MKLSLPVNPDSKCRGGVILRCVILATLVLSSFPRQAISQSLLQNGNFSKPLAPWKLYSLEGTPGTDKSLADGVLTVGAIKASDKDSNRQLVQSVGLAGSSDYLLEFEACSGPDTAGELVVVLTDLQGQSRNYGLNSNFRILPEWKKYSISFRTVPLTPGTPLLLKFLMGKMQGTICFRNVRLDPGEYR